MKKELLETSKNDKLVERVVLHLFQTATYDSTYAQKYTIYICNITSIAEIDFDLKYFHFKISFYVPKKEIRRLIVAVNRINASLIYYDQKP